MLSRGFIIVRRNNITQKLKFGYLDEIQIQILNSNIFKI